MRHPTARAWASFSLGCVALWSSFAAILYVLVQPLKFPNGQSPPVFDVAALLEAASLAAVVHFACWLLLFPLTWNAQPTKAAVWGIFSTWIVSSAIFLWIEGAGSEFIDHWWLTQRATEVLADGQSMAFMPVVVPALSIVSASLFAAVVWLSNRSVVRVPVE